MPIAPSTLNGKMLMNRYGKPTPNREVYENYTLDDYVDMEPVRVEWGAEPVSHVGDLEKWRCRWCGRESIHERASGGFECPHCPNDSGNHRGTIQLVKDSDKGN